MKELRSIGENHMPKGLKIEIGRDGVRLETTISYPGWGQLMWLAVATAGLAVTAVLMLGEKHVVGQAETKDGLDPEE